MGGLSDYVIESRNGDGIPISPLTAAELEPWLAEQPPEVKNWVGSVRFRADPGEVCLLPGTGGRPSRVLMGVEPQGLLWDWGGAPERVPPGEYRLDSDSSGGEDLDAGARAALGWALGSYRFRKYKSESRSEPAKLIWPTGCDRAGVRRAAEATFLVRDLVNTPASDLGPEELAAAARDMARNRGARCRVIVGDALLKANFPAVHFVGRGSPRAPRLIDIRWGRPDDPRVTLVGKGVCFDTGGLGLKPSNAMRLMKKDMAGAAHVLGLADMIMSAGLPVRLRVLIPAVENSVSGQAMRPLDVVTTRKGLTVEIGHTDAEGRVILADALAEACREKPALVVDFATLTGAARVALGPELPAMFSNDDDVAGELLHHGVAESDPVWRLPLHGPYRRLIEGQVADLTNAAKLPQAGAITAALFLESFVEPEIPWIHLDIMAWNLQSRPGRPEGGEATALRALFAMLKARFGSGSPLS